MHKFLPILAFTVFILNSASAYGCKAPYPVGGSQQIYGSCTLEVAPDRQLIAGGISEEAPGAAEAKSKIQSKLAKIKDYVTKAEGTLDLTGLRRAVREGTPTYINGMPQPAPISMVFTQSFVIELPKGADVDAALETLSQLGLNSYGMTPGYANPGQVRNIVSWTFSDPLKTVEKLTDNCIKQALATHCEMEHKGENADSCIAGLVKKVSVQNYNLQSQQVLNEQGYPQQIYLGYPGQMNQLFNLALGTEAALKFGGSISLMLQDQEKGA